MPNEDAVNGANTAEPNANPTSAAIVEEPNGIRKFLDPVVFIATLILLSVFYLIGAAIAGYDKVLRAMATVEFARGLITYLFAIVTIGTAVVLVVSALTGTESDAHKERFQRGKEILSLLLGVFGTIVGFYFGSEVSQKAGAATAATLQIAPIHLNVQSVPQGGQVILETYVSGGKGPYRYGVGFDDDAVEPSDKVESTGWIQKTVVAPNVTSERPVTIHVVVTDAEGNKAEGRAPVAVKPSQ